MVRPRRGEFEICMEILEILSFTLDSVPITEIIRKVGIKHIKARKLLEGMQELHWIREVPSHSDDQRFGRLYSIDEEGEEILMIYLKKIKELFQQLSGK